MVWNCAWLLHQPMCHFLNTTIINLFSQIFVMYLTVWLHDHFLVFLSLWEHGNHLPPKLAITESSRLSFVHVLVAVRDCQVDSITNRAMPCRLSIVDCRLSIVDCRLSIVDCRLSIVDCRLSIVDCRLSIVDCRLSIVDDRSTMIDQRWSMIDDRSMHRASSIDIEYRTQFWYGTVSNKLWMVST